MYRIGIDFGGTSIVAGLVDESMKLVDKVSVRTNAPRPIESMIEDMAGMTEELIAGRCLSREDIASVGVGVPGTANPENGHMEDANNLGFADTPFVSLLEERVRLPVRFGNDANAAAWGEYRTGGYEEDSFVMMTIGTGIGGGVILNDRLWAGINGAAAEFGHMAICCGGTACNCGRRGCFEAYASATALIRQARAQMREEKETALWRLCGGDPKNLEARTVFDGAATGDAVCRQLLDDYTTCLAEGVANIINIFQPAYLCVGGGVSRAGEALLRPLREKTAERVYSRNAKRNTRIVLARLDNDAGIIGAALLEP